MSLAEMRGLVEALFELRKSYLFKKKRVREIKALNLIANQRVKEIQDLAQCIGAYFRDTSSLFTAVGWGLYKGPGYGDGEIYEGKRSFCWEAPIAITIYLAGRPVLGMGVEFRDDALCVRQMQGVRGVSIPKHLNEWPKLFVEGCADFIASTSIEYLRIYKADQSLFYLDPDIELLPGEVLSEVVASHRQRMRRRYDGTARQLGFKKREIYWEWKNTKLKQP